MDFLNFCWVFQKFPFYCVILYNQRDTEGNCDLLGYYAASSGNSLPTFRYNLSAPFSRVKIPWPLKMGPESRSTSQRKPEITHGTEDYFCNDTLFAFFLQDTPVQEYITLYRNILQHKLDYYKLIIGRYPVRLSALTPPLSSLSYRLVFF